jgi:hypothetical protein
MVTGVEKKLATWVELWGTRRQKRGYGFCRVLPARIALRAGLSGFTSPRTGVRPTELSTIETTNDHSSNSSTCATREVKLDPSCGYR